MLWTSAYAREHLIERPRQSQAQLQAKRLAQGKECDANHDHVSYRSLAKRLWKEMFCAFFVFFVTLSLFPGITVTIPTQHTHDERFQSLFPVLLIFIFQVGDLVGRSLPSLVILVGPRYLWICVVARIAFFILFILCINPRVFDNDWAAYVIEAVFAVTNGYFGTLATIYGPAPAEEHEKEVAGNIMSFCLQFGVLTGAFFALLVLYLVNGKLTLS
jgi:equilibrative nucleoside transporter 1/2/3